MIKQNDKSLHVTALFVIILVIAGIAAISNGKNQMVKILEHLYVLSVLQKMELI